MKCCTGNCNQGRNCTVNTRKYPRTMVDAFGPYTDNNLSEPDGEPGTWKDDVVVVGCSLAGIALLAILYIWG